MFIHLAWGWCQTCSPANMIMYTWSEWVRQKIYISHVSVTDASAPYPHPVCFNLVSVATSFLFYSKHLLCSEIYFLEASPVWLKLMNITFCCDPLILLLCHNCWHFHSNSSAVVYRFSNVSADNWAKLSDSWLWSHGQVFRFQVWLWFNQQKFWIKVLHKQEVWVSH